MSAAGVAWGVYSLFGRGKSDPAGTTARNFLLAALVASFFFLPGLSPAESIGSAFETHAAWLAIGSGAVTSGLGYVIWYAALKGHTRVSAGIVQLAVPFLAAVAGVLLLDEEMTVRLFGSGVLTLGGVALAVRAKQE